MKQKLFLTIALLLGILFPHSVWGYDFSAVAPSGQTLYYNIVDGNAEVTYPNYVSNNNGYSYYYDFERPTGNLVIPSTVLHNGTSYAVTSIGSHAFDFCTGLTSITIPNSVTNIGYYAFFKCSSLVGELTIPNSVIEIGGGAFAYCDGLNSITIGESVDFIGEGAFQGCSRVRTLHYNAVNASSLSGGTIYHGSHNGLGLWLSGVQLTTLTIGESVTKIPGCAFAYMGSLSSITIPNSVHTIGHGAFYECTGLTSITIPESVNNIEFAAFFGCSGLTVLNYNAVNCTGSGFNSSHNTTGSVVNIPFSAHWLDFCSSLTVLNIGDSVTAIGDYAFYCCTELTSVTIPNSVTTVGSSAFRGCTSLTSVTLGESLNSIGGNAFRGCNGLTRITIPNSVATIGGSAFENCSNLRILDLGRGISDIGGGAFRNDSHIDTIYSHNSTPPVVADVSAFENVWKRLPLVVPGGSGSAYATAYAWRDFLNIVETPLSVTAEPADETMGSVAGSGAYVYDSVATLTATASHCYHFVQWNDGNTDNPRYVTVEMDTSFTAEFAWNAPVTGDTVATACDSFDWYEHTGLTTSQEVSHPYTGGNRYGCDSIVTLHLTINHSRRSHSHVTHCGPYTWDVNGRTYNQSGDKYSNGTTDEGCSARDTLTLTVLPTYSSTLIETACDSFTWNGTTYTETTVYSNSMTAANGCDSVETIRLTINHSQSSHEYITHCGPYTWEVNGRTYNQSGDKTYSGTTEEGCAIHDTLTLTVVANTESEITEEISAADLPYSFAGQTFETFGQYDIVIANAAGCDSTIHLTLSQTEGIESANALTQLTVYPNPTTGLVTLNVNLAERVEVLDLVGRCVAVVEDANTIDLSTLADGTYTLRIIMPEGMTLRKVVKR